MSDLHRADCKCCQMFEDCMPNGLCLACGEYQEKLQSQRDALLEACKTAMEIIADSYNYDPTEKYCESDCQAVNVLQAAIKLADGGE